jgi:DNA repair protein RecN (Recombination protein N)
MLRDLHIKNFAIIENLDLSFSEGLNILSGETGAGKSIIVGALTLLLGGRVATEMIRSSEEEAVVEALFDIEPDSPINQQLEAGGVARDENLLVKRVVTHAGKSKVFINGSLATRQMLSQLGKNLISISGQHENQTLLQADKHIDVLDEFGGLIPLREQMEYSYREFLEISRRLDDLETLESTKDERKELLRFQIKEIEDACLEGGEEERHRKEREVLNCAQRLDELTGSAYDTIYQGQDSATEHLRKSLKNLKGVVAIDETATPLFNTIETILYQLEDVAHSLKGYMQKITFDERRLEDIEIRLGEINRLKRKYGESLEEVIRYQEKAKKELCEIESNEEDKNRLRKELQKKEEKMMCLALELSEKRGQAAALLKKKVEEELCSLGMGKTIFEVKQEKGREGSKDSPKRGAPQGGIKVSEKGLDVIEFLISPNPGEGLRPLARIASGGELSRIVLALKRIITREKGSATVVFDEVDSGIGGATAEVVGMKLKGISRWQQILCITHLPQIASFADRHQSIFKRVRNGRTTTLVKKLDSPKEREGEIARMLGGAKITTRTREHAREMLKSAQRKMQGTR